MGLCWTGQGPWVITFVFRVWWFCFRKGNGLGFTEAAPFAFDSFLFVFLELLNRVSSSPKATAPSMSPLPSLIQRSEIKVTFSALFLTHLEFHMSCMFCSLILRLLLLLEVRGRIEKKSLPFGDGGRDGIGGAPEAKARVWWWWALACLLVCVFSPFLLLNDAFLKA